VIDAMLGSDVGQRVEGRDRAAHAEQAAIDEQAHRRGPSSHDLADAQLFQFIGSHDGASRAFEAS
jgi:tRNA(Arg) A34 adenosine deaminase TadA